MKRLLFPYLAITLLFTASCISEPKNTFQDTDPIIYPDYTNITIPTNIASPNFLIEDSANKYLTVLESGQVVIKIKGQKVQIPLRKWRKLSSQGDITVNIFEKKNNRWIKMKPFHLYLTDEIDSYLTYRIIPPSFMTYQRLTINQRNITNFREKVIYANSMASADDGQQCINCHNFKNWRTDEMQFHIRLYQGGTVMYRNGKLSKINHKTDSTISAAVYPSWHPSYDYIAYSTNQTFQNIHTNHTDRMEAFDQESDLILYDIANNSVSIIENDPSEMECHPCWTPDGKTLYYVSANIGDPEIFKMDGGAATDNKRVKYNLYYKNFDPTNKTWGVKQLVYNASVVDSSITWPRISPDGTKLIACISSHGVFPPYQSESDLIMFDLEKGKHRYLDEANSNKAESYHSWSSNGKWIVISSRREDGIYTRLYLSHMNEDGSFTKPFLLPQKDPEFSKKFMYSFNIPEFTVEPVKISARKLASFIKSVDASPVSFEQKRGE